MDNVSTMGSRPVKPILKGATAVLVRSAWSDQVSTTCTEGGVWVRLLRCDVEGG